MFQVMKKLGMPTIFVKMIRKLLHDATVFIDINNQVTKSFDLHREVHMGCPLASYLVNITTHALNTIFKYAMKISNLKGITLPQCNSQTNY